MAFSAAVNRCRAVAIGLTWAGKVASHLKVRLRSRRSLTSIVRRKACQSETVPGSSESRCGSLARQGTDVFGRTMANLLRYPARLVRDATAPEPIAARQDEEIASPYQTRVSFVRQLVPGWNRLGQRRQGLDTDRRFRLKNTTQEMCRDVGLEGVVTVGVWAITQKSGACLSF